MGSAIVEATVVIPLRRLVPGLVLLVLIAGSDDSLMARPAYAEDASTRRENDSKPAPGSDASAAPASRKGSGTIGHELLQLEEPLGTVRPEMFRLLDEVTADVRAAIGQRPQAGDANGQWLFALRTLREIDLVLDRRNFVYSTREDLSASLSDVLAARRLEPQLFQRIVADPTNFRRRARIARQPDGLFHTADCDTVSFIYLAIGEALDLPIALVEVPNHNFVRWYLTDRSFVNWETVHGIARSDRDFIRDYGIPQAAVENGTFLTRMTRENVLGYGHCIVAGGLEKQGRHKDAQAEYRLAIKAHARSPMPWNNLAWSLVTSPDPGLRNGREAVDLARKGVQIYRTANSLDTLACAYAEAGEFDKACTTALEACALAPANPELRKHIAAFQRRQTWIDLHVLTGAPEKAK